MAQRVRDILLRISGDASDAQRALEETANELKDFDNTTYEATVDVNTQAADLKMEAAEKALEDYDNMAVEARLDLQTAGAEAQLARLQQNLQNLQAKPTSPKIDIAIARTIGQIEKVEAQLDRLDRKRVEVDVDVDRDRVGRGVGGIAGGIGASISGAAEGLGLFVSAASRGIPVVGGLGALLVQMSLSGAALGPAFLAAAAALSITMIPVMALAAGAVAALGASLAAAAVGVGVLGIALAAAFGPVALVGFAAMARLPGIMKAVTADAKDLDKALKDLSPTERKLALALRDLKGVIGEVFKPATDAIFGGAAEAVKDLTAFAKDRQVRAGFQAIGRAIGGALRAAGAELRRPETRNAFANFARAGAQIIRRLTPVFTSLFRLVVRVADVAMPWLKQAIGDIASAIRGWAGDITRSGIERFVQRVRRSFNIWIGIVKELWGIVKAFFGDAKDGGDEMAESIRKILRRLRIWLETNPDKIEAFFEAVTWSAQAFLTVLEKTVKAINWISEHKGPSGIDILEKTPLEKIKGPSLIDLIKRWGKQTGGAVGGVGRGDIVPAMLEPGEFVIRRSVAQSIGVNRLNLLNAGNLAALGGSRAGMVIQQQDIHLPPAPGHNQLGDPRHQAVQLARELRRRGEQGIGGGGFP